MQVKVTVVILTYNHESYIAKALNSVLEQDLDASVQVLVADDGSVDNTINIVKEYSQRYPEVFTVLNGDKNKGVRINILNCLSEIKGEYIAILDGDDFWSDLQKLQKQINFLDTHPDFNGVFHDAEIVHIDNAQELLFEKKRYYSQSYRYQSVLFPEDVISRQVILPSSSALLRKSALSLVDTRALVDNYSLLWKLTCYGIKRSRFYFMNEPMSVYHNHQKGISKRDNEQFHRSHILFLNGLLKDEFYQDYKYAIYTAIVNEYEILLESKENLLNRKKMFRQYTIAQIRRLWFYRKKLWSN